MTGPGSPQASTPGGMPGSAPDARADHTPRVEVDTAPVERPVTVAVTGTHSTGKSSFLARLTSRLRQEGLEVATVADLGEEALRAGLPILHSHVYASTLWIMTHGISREVGTWPHADVLLVDRPVPDALGYYLAALAYRGEKPDPDRLATLRTLAANHSRDYDLIWRTVLDRDLPIGPDKLRDRDPVYRRLADQHIGAVLADLGLPHRELRSDRHEAELTDTIEFVIRKVSDSEGDLDCDTS